MAGQNLIKKICLNKKLVSSRAFASARRHQHYDSSHLDDKCQCPTIEISSRIAENSCQSLTLCAHRKRLPFASLPYCKKLSSFAPDGHFLRDGQVPRQFWKRQRNSVRDMQFFDKNNSLLRCDAMTFEH